MEGLNIKNLSRILQCLHVSSDLKVDYQKSIVFAIGPPNIETTNWDNLLICEADSLPFVYLGIPVRDNINLINKWKHVINKCQSKLSLWKSKTLSFGGKLTII